MKKHKDPHSKVNSLHILSKLINYLQYAPAEVTQKSTILITLKVLQLVIEIQEEEEKKVEMQNELDKLGATKMIMLVLSEINENLDSELLMSYMNFANSLLDGGNNKVQVSIYEFLTSY